ncbi:MAG: GDP-L-fucose synthase [Candidatus Omnitrophota bacterium]
MRKKSRILVTGDKSPAGAALIRRLKEEGFDNLIVPPSLKLTNQRAAGFFLKKNKPEYVFLIDVVSGGIMTNCARPAEFIYANLQTQNNIIDSCHKEKVKRLIFFGSSCAYPKNCPQPIKEDYLLTGPLEETSEAYAISKIAGIKMCQYYRRQHGADFVSVIPATIYGKDDNFDLESAHVIPALMRKFHEAKAGRKACVLVWGSGRPKREFLYADDVANGCLFLMGKDSLPEIINMGSGADISIRQLAKLIKKITGFEGKIRFDVSKPDGAYRKLLDLSRLKTLGWSAKTDLESALRETYNWYLENLGYANTVGDDLCVVPKYSQDETNLMHNGRIRRSAPTKLY